ncbi:uncharacterized protein LOC113313938 [Papaver somniferum]|uniref:uncharacterized protein LOC113313938 n=1 Tax=Papaver somniferum TaxID=3469 RepID=UPI000E706022|nr:uncharacterized protein LOC113313938 [Papaver somniferum]
MKISTTNPIMKVILLMMIMVIAVVVNAADDTNRVYQPCTDTKIQRSDGFSFGIAFSQRESFFLNKNKSIQLSPCDTRLSLSGSRLAIFRPKVDEISLLTINTTSFNPNSFGGHMVAFAGRKYAARSPPVFVADNDHIVTSFTLVLEFQKGTLQNLFWKNDKCDSCKGKTNFVCVNNQYCAIKTTSCKLNGGKVDCSLGIQLAFSGTDKHLSALNSWYEVEKLRQYSLYKLYSNLRGSLTDQFNKIF